MRLAGILLTDLSETVLPMPLLILRLARRLFKLSLLITGDKGGDGDSDLTPEGSVCSAGLSCWLLAWAVMAVAAPCCADSDRCRS